MTRERFRKTCARTGFTPDEGYKHFVEIRCGHHKAGAKEGMDTTRVAKQHATDT
jgi:hypothetical protein